MSCLKGPEAGLNIIILLSQFIHQSFYLTLLSTYFIHLLLHLFLTDMVGWSTTWLTTPRTSHLRITFRECCFVSSFSQWKLDQWRRLFDWKFNTKCTERRFATREWLAHRQFLDSRSFKRSVGRVGPWAATRPTRLYAMATIVHRMTMLVWQFHSIRSGIMVYYATFSRGIMGLKLPKGHLHCQRADRPKGSASGLRAALNP